jgi:hypothetical protein
MQYSYHQLIQRLEITEQKNDHFVPSNFIAYASRTTNEKTEPEIVCRGRMGEYNSLTLPSTRWKPELTHGIYSLSFRKEAGAGSKVGDMVHGFVLWPGRLLPGCLLL